MKCLIERSVGDFFGGGGSFAGIFLKLVQLLLGLGSHWVEREYMMVMSESKVITLQFRGSESKGTLLRFFLKINLRVLKV